MADVTEFSVALGVTPNTNALAPSLEWYCRQDTRCSYAPGSLSDGSCIQSIFRDSTHYAENIRSLSNVCNEILLEDGAGVFDGVSCSPESPCPATLYRYPDGRNKNAFCPGGAEMVISALGSVGGIEYLLTPAPGVVIVGDVPADCSLVGDAYRCDSGMVKLRFTLSGSTCDAQSGNCPTPSSGVAYGLCDSECATGPEPSTPIVTDTFSALLKVTPNTNALAPSLEWSCRHNEGCSVSSPPSVATGCSPSRFANFTHYAEHIRDLASGCNEIILDHGKALLGDGSCDILGNDAEPCGGVLYRIPDGRNKEASCPGGTQMNIVATGAVGGIDYIVEPTAGVELVGGLPDDCNFIAGGYRCKSGSLIMSFTQTSNRCIPQDGNCPFPRLGYFYGQCGAQSCSNGPQFITPPAAGDEFQVSLTTAPNFNSLAPALEWYCYQNQACSMAADSLLGTCPSSSFANFTEYGEGIRDLAAGCNSIVLEDGGGLYDRFSCNDADPCGAILYRYSDGRNKIAICPSGSEMVVYVVGTVGAIDYIITPQDGVELSGDVPSDCVLVGGGYRCESGQVKLRFAHTMEPCDATNTGKGCGMPVSGHVYGLCGESLACVDNVHISNITFEMLEPVTDSPVAVAAPTEPPTASPSSIPSASPSVSPSASPSVSPSASPSETPSATPTAPPSTSSPTYTPSSAASETSTCPSPVPRILTSACAWLLVIDLTYFLVDLM